MCEFSRRRRGTGESGPYVTSGRCSHVLAFQENRLSPNLMRNEEAGGPV